MSSTASQDTIRQQVRGYLAENLARPVADDEDIFAAGLLNSLLMVQLVVFVESAFELTVRTDELDRANFCSADAITAFVAAKALADAPR